MELITAICFPWKTENNNKKRYENAEEALRCHRWHGAWYAVVLSTCLLNDD